ncbi:MAG: cytochrome b/b6 domain-containing protein [Pseudomonadota bacterium]
MHATPSIHTTAQAAPAAATPGRRVTDAPTRMFHWLFALSFLGAYVTADGESWRLMHVTLGYTMAGLLVFRVLYGLLGPRQAGLGLMWRKLAGAPAWLRSLTQSRSLADINWRQGQNFLMALAVVALLLMVLPLTLSGYATYNDWGDFLGGDWLEEVHEFFGEAFLFVVLAHLALIAGLSLLRRKNQALPMLTGRIAGKGPDLVQKNRVWLAALLLLAVLAYGGWEWQQSPNGLISSKTWNNPATGQAHDED